MERLSPPLWKLIALRLEPIDTSRARATCRFFRSVIPNKAVAYVADSLDKAMASAASHGYINTVKFLLGRGVRSRPAFYSAISVDHLPIVKLLHRNNVSELSPALTWAISHESVAVLIYIIVVSPAAYAEANSFFISMGCNWAAYRGNRELYNTLVDAGGSPLDCGIVRRLSDTDKKLIAASYRVDVAELEAIFSAPLPPQKRKRSK